MYLLKSLMHTSLKGDGKFNEDIASYAGNYFWVIDGATDVFNYAEVSQEGLVSSYVNTLSMSIKNNLIKGDISLSKLLKQSIDDTGLFYEHKYPYMANEYEYKLPSFSVAMGRIVGSVMEYLVLGDCYIELFDGSKRSLITDIRIKNATRYNKQELRNLQNMGVVSKENEVAIYQKTRMTMNTEGGYWIGSFFASGIDKAITGSIDINEKTRILCYTDGYDLYNVLNAEATEQHFETTSIENNINSLVEMLNNDNERTKFTRTRKVDDLTVQLFEIVKGR